MGWDGWKSRAQLSVFVDGDFAATVADAMVGIVDAAELPRGNALYGLFAMDVIAFVIERDGALHEVIDMPHLEGDGERLGVRSRK